MKTISIFTLILGLLMSLGLGQNHPNFVDFEPGTLNGTHTPTENIAVDNAYFKNVYYVTFENVTSTGKQASRYAQIGAPEVAFRNTTPQPVDPHCGVAGPTQFDNPFNATNTDPGCWFMTDSDGDVGPNPDPLHIEYYNEKGRPCTIASGFLYDIDGSTQAEAWRLDLYEVGVAGPANSIYLVSDSYNNCTGCPALSPGIPIFNFDQANNVFLGGDGAATYWEMQTGGGAIDYLTMTYVGHPERWVGVAFDNFYYCSSAVDTCALGGFADYQVNGCGVQFESFPAIGMNTNVIAYHWDFGDGSTSDEANPFHTYAPFGTYTATLTLIGYHENGTCCTHTISIENIKTTACEPCQGEVSFTYTPDNLNPCEMTFTAQVSNQTTPVLGYVWDFGGTATAVGQTVQHELQGPTSVCLTVLFQDDQGELGECCKESYCLSVNCGGEGIQGEAPSHSESPSSWQLFPLPPSLKAYPNPSDQVLMIEWQAATDTRIDLELLDLNGKTVLKRAQLQVQPGFNQWKLPTAALADGIYLLTLRSPTALFTEKISIQH